LGQPEELDLSDVTLEVVERLQPLALHSGVALSTGSLPDLRVMGDRAHISRLLANLIENAIKYTSADGKSSPKQVVVETGCRSDADSSPHSALRTPHSALTRWAWVRIT